MNKYSLIVIMLLSLLHTSCSSDDDSLVLDDEKFVKIDINIPEKAFREKIIGEWHEMELRDFNPDGSLSKPIDTSTLYGYAPTQYRFYNDKMYIYKEYDANSEEPGSQSGWSEYEYDYNPSNNSVYIKGKRFMQILSLTDDIMITVEPSYPIYSYVTYKKVSE